jgi:hypothetical protein
VAAEGPSRLVEIMMAADMNDDPIKRFEYDHLTRKAVLESVAARIALHQESGLLTREDALHGLAALEMLRASQELRNAQPKVKESENDQNDLDRTQASASALRA